MPSTSRGSGERALRIIATPLWVLRKGGRPFPPRDGEGLDPIECVHGRVAFEIDGRSVPLGVPEQHGAGGYDDVCLSDWIDALAAASDDLAEHSVERFVEHARHAPAWSPFVRRGARVHVRDAARGVVVLVCDARELEAAIPSFLATLRAQFVAAVPDQAEAWWHVNRVGHVS